ncbi:uncharacterized protein VTP21DRAFT_547 [Calcarisporiella thermophila]|uniref:uncharacterized protein n=1 Tax=Calcarisporiella thermophila TaxID=911321 RepID=UPI0037427BC4
MSPAAPSAAETVLLDKDGKPIVVKKKPLSWVNLGIGAFLNLFEITTLGQPFEVLKTHLASHRGDSLGQAISKTYQRGGIFGFYQGLIPWAWIEAATKGAVLLWAASEVEYYSLANLQMSPFAAGLMGGMAGGLAQAYSTMGFCTFMKTVEITRAKAPGDAKISTWKIAGDILRREGIRGINKGVNAVALRQSTNWASRLGLSRLAETTIRKIWGVSEKDPLTNAQRIAASAIGGGLSVWNQPIEVIRVEMQSQVKSPGRPEKLNIVSCAKYIWRTSGWRGFYRGATPRIGLGMWQTICMVYGGDSLKAMAADYEKKRKASML